MSKILTLLILVILAVPVMGDTTKVEELDVPAIYKRTLPKLEIDGPDLPLVRANNIVDYLQLLGGGIPLNNEARDSYTGYIESHMRTGDAIQFVILGFPCKSTNLEKKVLSQKFDMGDYLGLIRLEHLAEQIQEFVGVPCEVHIINKEPYIPEMFKAIGADLGMGMELLNSAEYEASFLQLLGTCPHLRCGADLTEEYLKQKAMKIYHTEAAKALIEADAEGSKRFFTGELEYSVVNAVLNGKGKVSKNALEKERKRLGLLMSGVYQLGVTVFRDVVRAHGLYGSMLRLSVHGDETKVGINFASKPSIVCANTCVPWHAALLCERSGDGVLFDLVRSENRPAESHVTTMTVASVELSYILM